MQQRQRESHHRVGIHRRNVAAALEKFDELLVEFVVGTSISLVPK